MKTMLDLLEQGKMQLQRERNEDELRRRREEETHQAKINEAWEGILQVVKLAIPEAAHPYIVIPQEVNKQMPSSAFVIVEVKFEELAPIFVTLRFESSDESGIPAYVFDEYFSVPGYVISDGAVKLSTNVNHQKQIREFYIALAYAEEAALRRDELESRLQDPDFIPF